MFATRREHGGRRTRHAGAAPGSTTRPRGGGPCVRRPGAGVRLPPSDGQEAVQVGVWVGAVPLPWNPNSVT